MRLLDITGRSGLTYGRYGVPCIAILTVTQQNEDNMMTCFGPGSGPIV